MVGTRAMGPFAHQGRDHQNASKDAVLIVDLIAFSNLLTDNLFHRMAETDYSFTENQG